MHIVIAVITALGGLVWALVRLQNSGVDLNSFNPFWWARRRKWQKLHAAVPLHRIENTMEAAAVIVVGIAKLEGDITRETKQEICALFQEHFNIGHAEAKDLFAMSTQLLTPAINPAAEVRNILKPTLADFKDSQKESVMTMLHKVAEAEGPPGFLQKEYIIEVERQFEAR